ISQPPRRSRLAAGLVAAVIGVAAVFVAVRAFDASTERVSEPSAPVLSPAPRECPVGLINMATTDVATFLAVVHGQLPTWMPPGFGLLRTYGGGRFSYGVWSDQNCREVELNYSTFGGSPTIPSGAPIVGSWRVTGDVPDGCSNQVLGKARCLVYMTSTPEGTIVLNMMGLDREEGDRIALSIDLDRGDVQPSPVDVATFCGPGEQLMTMQPLTDRGYDTIEQATLAALSWVGVKTSLADVQQGMSVSAPDAYGEIQATIDRLPVSAARSDHVFLSEGPGGSYFVETILECQATHSP
ncbi:MAG: hypothetical protein ABJA81_03790, partial [Nocardioidaceae bacterium]